MLNLLQLIQILQHLSKISNLIHFGPNAGIHLVKKNIIDVMIPTLFSNGTSLITLNGEHALILN